jgi:uncharacterized membrane protein
MCTGRAKTVIGKYRKWPLSRDCDRFGRCLRCLIRAIGLLLCFEAGRSRTCIANYGGFSPCALVLGIVFLGEKITLYKIVARVLIVSGIILVKY